MESPPTKFTFIHEAAPGVSLSDRARASVEESRILITIPIDKPCERLDNSSRRVPLSSGGRKPMDLAHGALCELNQPAPAHPSDPQGPRRRGGRPPPPGLRGWGVTTHI